MAPSGEVRPTVLIVEDEWVVRDNVASAMQSAGWNVIAVASGEEALKLIADNGIDVVFTDIRLAGLVNGWQVGLACRDAGIPVVYTSGEVTGQPPPGKELFMAKPYDSFVVARTCRLLLDA